MGVEGKCSLVSLEAEDCFALSLAAASRAIERTNLEDAVLDRHGLLFEADELSSSGLVGDLLVASPLSGEPATPFGDGRAFKSLGV